MATSYDLPMPNDEWFTTATPDGGTTKATVVASVWGNDDTSDGVIFGCLLLLLPLAPFYAIVECQWGADAHGAYEAAVYGRWDNINEAQAHWFQNCSDAP